MQLDYNKFDGIATIVRSLCSVSFRSQNKMYSTEEEEKKTLWKFLFVVHSMRDIPEIAWDEVYRSLISFVARKCTVKMQNETHYSIRFEKTEKKTIIVQFIVSNLPEFRALLVAFFVYLSPKSLLARRTYLSYWDPINSENDFRSKHWIPPTLNWLGFVVYRLVCDTFAANRRRYGSQTWPDVITIVFRRTH